MSDVLVVVSKLKKMGKEAGLRTGKDYVEALSAKVDGIVKASIEKVKAEGKKKTIGAEDLT
ncbi:MAG: hypothetical protein JW983_06165 [Elusimicrobia bacterium]|nr:hypothetical protein [Elusimicrobiota bacterium]